MNALRMNEVAMKAREKVYTSTLPLVYQAIEDAAQAGHTNVKFMFAGSLNVPRAVVMLIEEELTKQGYTVKAVDDNAYLRIDWTLPKS